MSDFSELGPIGYAKTLSEYDKGFNAAIEAAAKVLTEWSQRHGRAVLLAKNAEQRAADIIASSTYGAAVAYVAQLKKPPAREVG